MDVQVPTQKKHGWTANIFLKGQQIEGDWLTSPVFWVRITCVTSKKQKHLLRLKENIVIQFKEKQRKSSKNIGYFLHVQYTA